MSGLWPLPARFHLPMVAAKYALASGVAFYLALWWVPKDVLSAAFVALLCTRPSLVGALREARDQIVASAAGSLATIAVLVISPIAPWTVGLSIAATYLVSTWRRWSYPTLVVALFSSLYMTILPQDTLWHTALLRFQSLILGVVVALAVNALFAPLSTRVNLGARLDGGLSRVRGLLASVAEAVRAGRAEVAMGAFAGTYRALGELLGDLADLTREVRLRSHPGGLSLAEAAAGDRVLRELEWVAHFAQDVALAASRVGAGALAERAADVLAAAAETLALVEARALDRAGDRLRAEREALSPLMAARHEGGGDASRLALVLALVQVQDHLGEVVAAMTQLAKVAEAPQSA